MEHRWGERVAMNMPIRLTLARAFSVGSGQLSDLSVSGGWIITDQRVRVLSQIGIVLNPGRVTKCDAAVIAAYVTRQCKNGIGVEWCQFAPPTVAELLRSVSVRPFVRSGRSARNTPRRMGATSAPLLKHGSRVEEEGMDVV